jgi:hypothetical protein
MGVAADAGASAGAPDPQRLALADRYMSDVHSEHLVQSLFEEGLRRAFDAEFRRMNAGIPVIPQSMQDEMYRASLEASRALAPRLHERMVRLLASEYTTEQLQALVDFYETPVGRAIANKSLDLAAATRRVTEGLAPQFVADMKRRFCARDAQCGGRGSQPPG